MISMVRPLPVGNALRISVEPPAGALLWRILRKVADTFTGETDPDAYVAYEGNVKHPLDTELLLNATTYYYKAYYFNGATWSPSTTAHGIPNATYADASTDALEILRDRLAAGLAVEVQRGTFTPSTGEIQVLTAPPAADGGIELPVVTVHLTQEGPVERGLGEEVGTDDFDPIGGQWFDMEGWLASVEIEVTGWSLNPDERINMRKALRRIVVANLPVFDASGIVEVSFSQQDVDALSGEYGANVYQVMCNFRCTAPVRVGGKVDPVSDVEVSGSSYQDVSIN